MQDGILQSGKGHAEEVPASEAAKGGDTASADPLTADTADGSLADTVKVEALK